jgi:hypothetical protein
MGVPVGGGEGILAARSRIEPASGRDAAADYH